MWNFFPFILVIISLIIYLKGFEKLKQFIVSWGSIPGETKSKLFKDVGYFEFFAGILGLLGLCLEILRMISY